MSTYDEHTEGTPPGSRPHSIDLTLELERELEAESAPNSPSDPSGRPHSLDTHVLASIITQLRMNVEDLTKDRDALAKELADSKTREAEMSASLTSTSEKCARLETELAAAQEKVKEDEESISMLRTKVEESRRGLMALQTENRRKTLDLSRAGQPLLTAPLSSKRASFTPLTGSAATHGGHRRISSVSEFGLRSPALSESSWSQIPRSPNESYTAPPQSKASRRTSGFFGLGVPVADTPLFIQIEAFEMESLRKELAQVKDQLEEAQHELNETIEAKSLSDDCVRSLRAFITESSIGVQANSAVAGVKTAAPTPANTPQSVDHAKSGSVSRWGFKLWNTSTPSPTASPASRASQTLQDSPLSKKVPAVPSARASISSVSSLVPPMQHMPSLAGSETSSVADSSLGPISPVNELPQLPRTSIVLEDGSGLAFAPSESAERMKTAASVESVATAQAEV